MKPNHLILAALSLALAALLPAASGLAQDRTTNAPLEAAREMFATRLTAAQATAELQRTHRQTTRQVAALLGPAGYATPDVVHALVGARVPAADAVRWMLEERQPAGATAVGLRRAGLADVPIATALRAGGVDAGAAVGALHQDLRIAEASVGKVAYDGGYPLADTRTALQGRGIRADPEYRQMGGCVGWDDRIFCPGASRVPMTWSEAMGDVSWSPQGSGETGATLTLESTNIPSVEIRIGSQALDLIEATSSRIRAVLPSGPTTGDLVMVRKPDGVVGMIEAGYAVVAPPAAASPAAWSAWGAAAVTAAVAEIRLWAANAELLESHCTVNGPLATGTKGILTTRDDFDGQIRAALLNAGAPPHVAEGWDRAMAEAWNGWADNVTVVLLPWYPSFLTWPGADAPPMTNVPTPLAGLISTGAPGMAAPALSERIEDEIGSDAAGTDAGYAIAAFANEIGLRFLTFVATRQVMNVMGSGPVPSYNPPVMPAGPVEGGTCSGYGVLVGGDF